MVEITQEQMYLALLKAAAMVKDDARIRCPYYKLYISTSKGDEEDMCEKRDYLTKCEWPYGCPLLAKPTNDETEEAENENQDA